MLTRLWKSFKESMVYSAALRWSENKNVEQLRPYHQETEFCVCHERETLQLG